MDHPGTRHRFARWADSDDIPMQVLKEMLLLLPLPAPDQATSGTYAISRANASLCISLWRASYDLRADGSCDAWTPCSWSSRKLWHLQEPAILFAF
eukprot:jgi/Picsp_1/1877/NSC_05343-R1_---NA---